MYAPSASTLHCSLRPPTVAGQRDASLLADAPSSIMAAAVAAGPVVARGEARGVVGPAQPPFDSEEDQRDVREKQGSAADDAIATSSGAFNNLAQA